MATAAIGQYNKNADGLILAKILHNINSFSFDCLSKALLKIAYLQLSSHLFANTVDVAILVVFAEEQLRVIPASL